MGKTVSELRSFVLVRDVKTSNIILERIREYFIVRPAFYNWLIFKKVQVSC